MTAMLRARSTPYAPALRADQRVCIRCGIIYGTRSNSKSIECRDCRGME